MTWAARAVAVVITALLSHWAMWTAFWVMLMLALLSGAGIEWWVIALPLMVLYGGLLVGLAGMAWLAWRGSRAQAGEAP